MKRTIATEIKFGKPGCHLTCYHPAQDALFRKTSLFFKRKYWNCGSIHLRKTFRPACLPADWLTAETAVAAVAAENLNEAPRCLLYRYLLNALNTSARAISSDEFPKSHVAFRTLLQLMPPEIEK
jgi:hypothetical protein